MDGLKFRNWMGLDNVQAMSNQLWRSSSFKLHLLLGIAAKAIEYYLGNKKRTVLVNYSHVVPLGVVHCQPLSHVLTHCDLWTQEGDFDCGYQDARHCHWPSGDPKMPSILFWTLPDSLIRCSLVLISSRPFTEQAIPLTPSMPPSGAKTAGRSSREWTQPCGAGSPCCTGCSRNRRTQPCLLRTVTLTNSKGPRSDKNEMACQLRVCATDHEDVWSGLLALWR